MYIKVIKVFLFVLFFTGIFFSASSSITSHRTEDTNTLKKEVQIAINSLSKESPFAFYNLHLSQSELNVLRNIKINSVDEYNNFGELGALHGEVKEFIKLIGNENERTVEIISQIVSKIVKNIVRASGKETAWVALRSFVPTMQFNQPRWHTDGYYYKPYLNQYKFAISLKSKGTIFYKLSSDMREKFFALEKENNRQALTDMLNDSHKRFQAKTNQGAVFVVGSNDSAVHSEPHITEGRLFLSILPGTKEQIKEWKSSQY